jgi:hypothetical protein
MTARLEGGLVTLKIYQEVSKVKDKAAATGTQYFKTVVENELIANDGQTIIIGGLIDENVFNNRQGVPFLSKIPILGFFFGTTDDTAHRREIIVLIRPRIIRDWQDAENLTQEYKDRLVNQGKTGIKRKELNDAIPLSLNIQPPNTSENRIAPPVNREATGPRDAGPHVAENGQFSAAPTALNSAVGSLKKNNRTATGEKGKVAVQTAQ